MKLGTASFLCCLLPVTALAVPLPQPRPPGLGAMPEEPPARTATETPLPLPRPGDLKPEPDGGPTPPPPGLAEAEIPPDPPPDPVCDELETSGEVEFERLDRIAENQCGALTPISLSALKPKDGPPVTFETPVTVTCAIARQALVWLTTSVQPAAGKHLGEPIVRFRQTGGYECRGRNRVAGAKLSEHGRANALDIGGFESADGRVVTVGESTSEAELDFLKEIRAAACGPFTTVLGPGVAAHDGHLHLDLAQRRSRGRYSTYCR